MAYYGGEQYDGEDAYVLDQSMGSPSLPALRARDGRHVRGPTAEAVYSDERRSYSMPRPSDFSVIGGARHTAIDTGGTGSSSSVPPHHDGIGSRAPSTDENKTKTVKKRAARSRRCKIPNCTKTAKIGGVCVGHGAKVKRCRAAGCQRQVVNSGVCVTHGAKVRRCKAENCSNVVVNNGYCISHGAVVRRCTAPGCGKYAQKEGLCIGHSRAKDQRICAVEGCDRFAKKEDNCLVHFHALKKDSLSPRDVPSPFSRTQGLSMEPSDTIEADAPEVAAS